jgi:hypothetical protein
MKTTIEIQSLIFDLTGFKTSVKKLQGSMQNCIRFEIKGMGRISEDHRKQIASTLNNKCYTDWWSIDVKKEYIKDLSQA